jgi:hypothetical protein
MTRQRPNPHGFDGMDLNAETLGHSNTADRATTTCVLMLVLCVCVWLTPFSRQPKSGLLGPAALLMLQQRAFSCISVSKSKILYLPEKI